MSEAPALIRKPGLFDRYTDRARRAVALADREAASAGYDTVDTGHLLLGLIGEGGGVAFTALGALGVTLEAADKAVRARRPADAPATGAASREFTPGLRRVLESGISEALKLGNNYIATEHLLLALVRECDGPGVLALADCGITVADVRARVLELLKGYGEAERARTLAGTPVAVSPRTGPEPGYQVITLGGETAAIVPVEDLRMLLAIARRATSGDSRTA